MYMYLPIALTSVNYLLVVGLGLAVGLLSGLFGVGGGFLMTPLLMMIGIPPTIAAATDANQIVAASASGTFAHWRLGNVDFKMGLYLLIGGFLGGAVGVQIIKILRATGGADFLIKITYVVMLGVVGTFMFFESLQALRKQKAAAAKGEENAPAKPALKKNGGLLSKLPMQTYFEKSGVTHSALVPLGLGVFVGILAGWYPCRHYGCRRWFSHGACYDLFITHAYACGCGNQSLPDHVHLYRGYLSAGLSESHS